MEFQKSKENFSKLCHKEGHLRHAIIDFDTKRLFCGSGAMVACKPLKFEENDFRYKQGLTMLHAETIDISKGMHTTLLNSQKIQIDPLGTFDYAPQDKNVDNQEIPIPNPSKICDEFNDREPIMTIKVSAKALKAVLQAIGHEKIAINIFQHKKYDDKIDSAIIIDNLNSDELDSAKAIVMQQFDDGSYQWKGFSNQVEFFEHNLKPVDISQGTMDFDE